MDIHVYIYSFLWIDFKKQKCIILDIMLFYFNDDVIFETGYGTVTFKAFN